MPQCVFHAELLTAFAFEFVSVFHDFGVWLLLQAHKQDNGHLYNDDNG